MTTPNQCGYYSDIIPHWSTIGRTYNISTYPNLEINFWGITKCANTAIKKLLMEAELETTLEWQLEFYHSKSTYINIKQALANGRWNFSVVRNPYYRWNSYVSYHFDKLKPQQKYKASEPQIKKKLLEAESKKELKKIIGKVDDIEGDVHFRSQCSYIVRDDKILVDYYNSVDHLDEVVDQIKAHSKKSIGALDKINSTDMRNVEFDDFVLQRYAIDFAILGFDRTTGNFLKKSG